MDELRNSHAHIYFHDESWINLGEVKRSVWVLEGQGRIRQNDGRGQFSGFHRNILFMSSLLLGKRLAVSALISTQGYHLDSVDVFVCSENQTMDNDRFLNWLTSACMKLRIFHGE